MRRRTWTSRRIVGCGLALLGTGLGSLQAAENSWWPFSSKPSGYQQPAPSSPPFGAPAASRNPLERIGDGISGAWKRTTEGAARLFQGEPTSAKDPVSLNSPGKPSPQFHVTYGQLQERGGKTAEALASYQKALELDPNHLLAQLSMGRLYDRQGKFAEALEWYTRAAQQHPNEPAAHNDLGLCLARQGRFADAAIEFDRAVSLAPERTLYRNNLATVLVELGRQDDALRHLTAAHGAAVAHYNLGYLLQRRGQVDAAREQFALAAQIDPSLTAAQSALAQLAPLADAPAASIAAAPTGTPGAGSPAGVTVTLPAAGTSVPAGPPKAVPPAAGVAAGPAGGPPVLAQPSVRPDLSSPTGGSPVAATAAGAPVRQETPPGPDDDHRQYLESRSAGRDWPDLTPLPPVDSSRYPTSSRY